MLDNSSGVRSPLYAKEINYNFCSSRSVATHASSPARSGTHTSSSAARSDLKLKREMGDEEAKELEDEKIRKWEEGERKDEKIWLILSLLRKLMRWSSTCPQISHRGLMGLTQTLLKHVGT